MLLKAAKVLDRLNSRLLNLGQTLGWMLLALMLGVILLQVFCRYVLNSALSWPEPAARALMVWMMALIVPQAYRKGGFMAIDMFARTLPRKTGQILQLFLLGLACAVLVSFLSLARHHFHTGFLFRAAGLKISLAWIYLSISVCFTLLLLINLELIVHQLARLFSLPLPALPGSEADTPSPQAPPQDPSPQNPSKPHPTRKDPSKPC